MTNRTLRVILIPPVQPLAAGNFPDKTANLTYDSYELLIIYPFSIICAAQIRAYHIPEYFQTSFATDAKRPGGTRIRAPASRRAGFDERRRPTWAGQRGICPVSLKKNPQRSSILKK